MKQNKKREHKQPVSRISQDDIGRLQNLATDHGLTVRFSDISRGGRGRSYHVMFERDGRRVLNFWPVTGKTHNPNGCQSGESAIGYAADSYAALDEAARLTAGDPRQDDADRERSLLLKAAEEMLLLPPEVVQNQAGAAQVWMIARRLAMAYIAEHPKTTA